MSGGNIFNKIVDPIGLFTSSEAPKAAPAVAGPMGAPNGKAAKDTATRAATSAVRGRASTILTDELGVGSNNGKRRQLGVG